MNDKLLIAFILYLQTWLHEDEDLEDMPDDDLKELYIKWIDEWVPKIHSVHSGDCTKQPWSCMRCWFDREMRFADRVVSAIEKHGSVSQ